MNVDDQPPVLYAGFAAESAKPAANTVGIAASTYHESRSSGQRAQARDDIGWSGGTARRPPTTRTPAADG
jgi:hypothetical protein